VFVGLKAAVKHRLGVDTTDGLIVAIQGLGKVGMGLAKRLRAEGARLVVADVNAAATRRAAETLDAEVVAPEDIVTVKCDVLSPNALGAILNEETIPALHARVIAGGANNQLAIAGQGEALCARDILYAPDYVINGGGIIRVAGQIFDWRDDDIERRVLAIADTLSEIFRRADAEGVTTDRIADRMAEERMAAGRSSASFVGVPGRSCRLMVRTECAPMGPGSESFAAISIASNLLPNSRLSVSKRASGTAPSPKKRKPIIERSSFAKRAFAQAISAGEASIAAARFFDPAASGIEGCERTGATTEGSVIMANA